MKNSKESTPRNMAVVAVIRNLSNTQADKMKDQIQKVGKKIIGDQPTKRGRVVKMEQSLIPNEMQKQAAIIARESNNRCKKLKGE